MKRPALLPALIRTLVALAIALVAVPAGAEQPSPADALALAEASFAQGLRLEQESPGSGAAAFLRSADQFQHLIQDWGVQNHALHAARGSALLLAGDVGRAVAAFRRAEALDPTSPVVRQGLAAARARVGAAFTPSIEYNAAHWALGWRGHVPRPLLLLLALAGWVTLWTAAALGAARSLPTRRWVIAGALVTLLGATPLTVEAVLTAQPQGVTTSAGAVGLNGPAQGVYQPTFQSPLPAGVEFRILEQRDRWVHVRLPDGRQTWLPSDALERI